MRSVVGFSLKIKRAWLDALLDQLVRTTEEAELRAFLDQHLKDELPGPVYREKTVGIVLRIWSRIPSARVPLRDRAVAMLPVISGHERIWLHWGMSALAYPFFRDSVEVVGRLSALQDDFAMADVQRRLVTSWGDRHTIMDAVQRLLTTLVDWEVLRSEQKGHFIVAQRGAASTPELQLWLLEALLTASAADEVEAQNLLRLPESFPFVVNVSLAELRAHEGFDVHRQGLNMDMVSIRGGKARATAKPKRKLKHAFIAEDGQPVFHGLAVAKT